MSNQTSKVKVWEETLTIPTYRVGPDDQNPPILINRKNPIHPGGSIIYPYPIQEILTNIKEDKPWRAVYLENDFLRLIVLPDLGGHLLSVFDKVAAKEAIYRNHVLKYARIGIRGAWVSGGIEWNFPNGHTVTTTSPIDYVTRENEDGSCSVTIGDIERVSRMRWSVCISLYPESALFETEVHLFNRTPLPNRFWFWANSAIPSSPGLEYITTASKVMTLQDVMDYPIHDEVNIRWDKNHMEAQDLFSLNSVHDFVAWYNHDSDRGLINYADRTDAPGKKFYTWGNSDAGTIWTELLTDEDGPYAEMQSGRLLTMRIWEIMPPCSVETWKESWYPVRKIGTPVFANRDTAFSLNVDGDHIQLGVQVTTAQSGAVLSIKADEQRIFEKKINPSPANPTIYTVSPVGALTGKKKLTITMKNSTGIEIARYEHPVKKTGERDISGYIKIEPDPHKNSPEECWDAGQQFEKTGDFTRAAAQYEKALSLDGGYVPAHRSRGILYLRQGSLDLAAQEFQAALVRMPGDPQSRFYSGITLMHLERFEEAIEEFLTLGRSDTLTATGAHMLGGLYAGAGDYTRALLQLKKAHRKNVENSDTLALMACTYRKMGDGERAKLQVQRTLQRDPLNFLACFENYMLEHTFQGGRSGVAAKTLKEMLRDEVQSYLELAADYGRFGLYEDAVSVLDFYMEYRNGKDTTNPMLPFYLGYYQEKTGDSTSAHSNIEWGTTLPHAFVFPHRVESEKVLRNVLKIFPKCGKAAYYLGNLLCAKGRVNEAITFWERAARTEKKISVIYRNLGRAYRKVLGDPDRAASAYEKAIDHDPDDYKLYCELDKLYVRSGALDKRKRLIERIPDSLKNIDMIAERIANYLTDTGEYDEALLTLRSTQFFPWEFYTEGRSLYEETVIGKGIALMEEGLYREAIESFKNFMIYPRNMGVGKPYRTRHAEALFRIGLAHEKLGNKEEAIKRWMEAVQEHHEEGDVLRYYQARSLQKLRRKQEAAAYLDALERAAERNLIDKRGNEEDNLYLLGMALKGKGEYLAATKCFTQAAAKGGTMRRCVWEIEGRSGE